MSDTKKFYWLRLKDDFFNNKEVKKLRRIAGGDTFTIIYLKMQLLSIKKDGLIKFEGTEVDLSEQLSLELDEELDNVKIVLAFMEANNLIENLEDDKFLLPKVPPLIGSETDAAERMRKMRNNVTPLLQDVTQSKREEKKEKKESKDTEQNSKSVLSKVQEALFDEFWNNYPKKKAKGEAIKAWNKIKPNEELASSIIHAIINQKQQQSWTKEEGKYIPHPASWLNAMRWEDETEAQVTQQSKYFNPLEVLGE